MRRLFLEGRYFLAPFAAVRLPPGSGARGVAGIVVGGPSCQIFYNSADNRHNHVLT
jgi:hypothetical protein